MAAKAKNANVSSGLREEVSDTDRDLFPGLRVDDHVEGSQGVVFGPDESSNNGDRFLLPRLLGKNFEGLDISPDSDELEMMYLDDIPEEYFEIWTRGNCSGPRRCTTESSRPCGHASSRSSENSNMSRAVNGALGS